jgi:pimeloyl-ACP methyl ester carboxylesterase
VQENTTSAGRHAPVNGLSLYYEIHGSGEPLILLHGGVAASEAFGPNLAALARGRQVIAVHLQGHGRTRDIDRPLRCELMADDIAALIAHLGLARADLLGYSMGGGVALQTAIRHPEVVRKLVVISVPMRHDASYPEVIASFNGMAASAAQIGASLKQSPMAQLYPDVDWGVLFTKLADLVTQDYDWSSEVAAIAAPTMLVFADADSIRPEHIIEFYKQLGGGQRDAGLDGSLRPSARLAIVPGTTHYNILATSVIAELVAPFLDAVP